MKFKKRSDEADVTAQENTQEEKNQKNSRKMELNVILYTVVLFVAAMVLILLSYAIQQRAASLQPENTALSCALDEETPGNHPFSINTNLTGYGGI